MKTAIITGASSGMGMEFVKQIDERFHGIDEFWLIARRTEPMEELSKLISRPCRILSCDLTKEAGIQKLEEEIKSSRPDIKILVNSAGFGKFDTFLHLSEQENTDMVRLNCEALMRVTYAALPFMHKGSMLISFASSAAFLPQPKFAVYAATKSFVLSFTSALKTELRGKGIRITSVCPGPVDTAFFGLAEEKHDVMWYKKLIMADCDKVVKKALQDALSNKDVSVYGWPIKAFRVLAKVLPHGLLLRIVGALNGKEKE